LIRRPEETLEENPLNRVEKAAGAAELRPLQTSTPLSPVACIDALDAIAVLAQRAAVGRAVGAAFRATAADNTGETFDVGFVATAPEVRIAVGAGELSATALVDLISQA
jgi:hypothetical protein